MLQLMENVSFILGTVVTPLALLLSAVALFRSVNLINILRPRNFLSSFFRRRKQSGVSPFRALSVALAGTLGVGNITGVASALLVGGPGAVFWMWVGAFVVLGVKYAEVYLAVKYRQQDENGYYGGAMYYIRCGLARRGFPSGLCKIVSFLFALLCCANSLITGNLVQANAAATAITTEKPIWIGYMMAALVLASILFGVRKIEKITAKLIPALTVFYIAVSLWILLVYRDLIPQVFLDIVKSAFSFRPFLGGTVGFTMLSAMRFGIMRGIFSNEAGCGTSPIAHAAADTDSPHDQGCLGIFEVLFDTVILCSLTAFVLLIAGERFGLLPWGTDTDPSGVTLRCFEQLAGTGVYHLLRISIVLFAYATIVAQLYYGSTALRSISNKKGLQIAYSLLSVFTVVAGSVITAPQVWLAADLIIGTMTAVNCFVIILLRRDLKSPALSPPSRRKGFRG